MRLAWLFVASILLGAGGARGDDFSQRYDAGVAAANIGRYADAVRELEAAYAIRQHPPVLLELARAHQRLGHGAEALEHYQRYLIAESDPDAATRAEVEREIAKLRAVIAPMPAIAPTVAPPGVQYVPPRETRGHSGLMGGGIALLAIGYTPALICGILFPLFNAFRDDDFTAASVALLIPVAGPFVSGTIMRQNSWALPWIVVDGLTQVTGLVMTAVGSRLTRRVPALERVGVAPFASPGGGGLATTVRF